MPKNIFLLSIRLLSYHYDMVHKFTSMGGEIWEFPETIWKDILDAKDHTSEDCQAKVNFLVQNYWKPVYKYIRVAWNKTNEEAKDLTQEYFTRFFEKDYFQSVTPDRGKFRSFVKASLRHFLMDMKKLDKAQKRGGDSIMISFEDMDEDLSDKESGSNPAEVFDREWAKQVMEKAVIKLKEQLERKNKGLYYKVFETYTIKGKEADKELSYPEVADRLGIKQTDVGNYLKYCRKMLKRILYEEISRYVSAPEEVEEEFTYLSSLRF